MNQAITVELQFFLISVLSGGILLLIYDLLRIIRRLMKHDSFFIALEDMIFWVGASLFIFSMMYKENDGVIRGFSIMGMLIGMILYHYIIDDILVNLIVRLIRTLISPFIILMNKLKKCIRRIWDISSNFVNFIIRRLKKRTKSVKIALDKRKQAASVKRKQHREEKLIRKQKASEKKQAKKAQLRKEKSSKKKPDKTQKGKERPDTAKLERVRPETEKSDKSKTGKTNSKRNRQNQAD